MSKNINMHTPDPSSGPSSGPPKIRQFVTLLKEHWGSFLAVAVLAAVLGFATKSGANFFVCNHPCTSGGG